MSPAVAAGAHLATAYVLAAHLSSAESIAVIIGAVIGGLGFLFTLITLAGGNYRAVKSAKIVADYQAGYNAVKAKADGQAEEIAQLQQSNAHKDAEISRLKEEISDLQGRMTVLQEVVTGRTALEELTAQLARMTESMNSKIGEVLQQVGELRGEVRGIAGNSPKG